MVGAPDGVRVVDVSPLDIDGAFRLSSPVHEDERGAFREWFKYRDLDVAGLAWTVVQANLSRSARDAVRGLHFSLAPEGQAKIVTCVDGELVDVLVDVRDGSPTFGRVVTVSLIAGGVSVYVPSGVAHGWCAVSEWATLCYLLSSPYAPELEREVHPLDPDLQIAWPLSGPAILSPKDAAAPSLAECRARGELPRFMGADRTVA